MKPSQFIGREVEMTRLKGLLDKKSASLIVVRGRRRIGKSRLLAEFGKEMKSYFFSGNPPVRKTTAQTQRNDFSRQLERLVFVALNRMIGVIYFGLFPRKLKKVESLSYLMKSHGWEEKILIF